MAKLPKTLAKEVVTSLFQGLLSGKPSPVLAEIYANWLDSVNYRESFEEYLGGFQLPAEIEPGMVVPRLRRS